MKRINLILYRKQAKFLIKLVRNGDNQILERFRQCEIFTNRNNAEILIHAKLKHALDIVAVDNGFQNWADLKAQFQQRAQDLITKHYICGYLNHWFATYEDSQTYLHNHGGYLLPYKHQFYVCDKAYIREYGFDSEAPQWQQIGYDMVNPRDRKAWLQLLEHWCEGRKL